MWFATKSSFPDERPIRVDENKDSSLRILEHPNVLYLFWEIPQEYTEQIVFPYTVDLVQSSLDPKDFLYIIPKEESAFIRVKVKNNSFWWYIVPWKYMGDEYRPQWRLVVLSQEEYRR